MEILYLNEVDSTHTYLKNYIKENGFKNPVAVVTQNQTNGIGSRTNSWEGKTGNLFLSFVMNKSVLPLDLPLQSSSIYFSYILKDILNSLDSQVWLKWPNDFYIENKKIGGTITNLSGELIYCGIGLNLYKVNNQFGHLDISINLNKVLNIYFQKLESKISWKHIFSKYSIEFEKSRQMETTINNQKKSLEHSMLNSDGSIFIDKEKVFSLR
ncbi:MAG: biotin--[acetyl-CoA-carboxylase] ligase [Campylobacterota bacterium]|nr:biotin--[acetyl-CoA-carboxylase] ligase [Campylobacterota bacterium]